MLPQATLLYLNGEITLPGFQKQKDLKGMNENTFSSSPKFCGWALQGGTLPQTESYCNFYFATYVKHTPTGTYRLESITVILDR